MTAERIVVSNARGESFADITRRLGTFGVLPGDTDATALLKMSAQVATDAGLLAAANYFPDEAAGEAGTTTGEFFSYADGAGGLVYAERTLAGSIVIAEAATKSMVEARVPYVGTGAVVLDGVATGVEFPRLDGAFWIFAPAMGEHAIMGFKQPDRTDECAIAFYIPNAGGTFYQYATIFNALITGTDIGFTAFHGEVGPAGNDNTPMVLSYGNWIEVLGGSTGTSFWQNGLTDPNVFHNFQNSYLQGWVVVGLHAQSRRGINALEVNGPTFIGTIDGSTLESTHGALISWNGATNYTEITSYSFATDTPQNMLFTAAALKVASSTLAFFNGTPVTKRTVAAAATDEASAITLANSLRTAFIDYNMAA